MEKVEIVNNLADYMDKINKLIKENYRIIEARFTYKPFTRGIIIAEKIIEK